MPTRARAPPRIDFAGGSLIDFGRQLNRGGRSVKLKGLEAVRLAGKLTPFLFAPGAAPAMT